MNTPKPIAASEMNRLVTADELARIDEYYAKRRLPEATPSGAEERTYCFRVEFEHDLYPLSHMLRWAIEAWWSSPLCPWGDADVKMTLKPGALNLAELRWLLARVNDCHVAVETIELERHYTGERKYRTEQELACKVPSTSALKASLAGLISYRESLSAAAERALDAEAELGVEINTRYFAKRMSRVPRISAEPLPLTNTRSQRAST